MLRAASTPGCDQAASRVTTIMRRPGSGAPIEAKVLRPITSGRPIVSALKRLRSLLIRHGNASADADRAVPGDGGDQGNRGALTPPPAP